MLKQNSWAIFAGALCLLTAFAAAQEQSPTAIRNAVREYRQQHEVEIVRSFAQLLSLPNVASDTANITRNAEAISTMLEQRAPLYAEVATATVATAGREPGDVVAEVAALVGAARDAR